jgi:hypothetical protein
MSSPRPLSLAAVLGSIEGLPDLPHLAAWLGAQPLWQPFAPVPRGCSAAALVGRLGDVLWTSVECRAYAERAAMREARRLSAEGRQAVVIALARESGPASMRVALAVSGGIAPLSLDPRAPDRVAQMALERLQLASGEPAANWLARAVDALAGQGAGAAFFRCFRDSLASFERQIDTRARGEQRRTLALIQLTRLLFLYFVQSKGWLDHRPAYIREEVDRALNAGRNLQRWVLAPLFFGALACPSHKRSERARALGNLPFLNGGLFTPHPIERSSGCTVPDTAWCEAVDQLFERFHFTVAEDDASGHAIAPDMLGHVFERVMAADRRKEAGAFYTPADLVRRTLDEGLASAVMDGLEISRSEASERLERGDAKVRDAVADLRVLDPACGSGAFLLGALERITQLRASPEFPAHALRRKVLSSQIFGVDLDPMAIRLTELRLWLAVTAGDPPTEPLRVEPLPNLDASVRQGDALREPAELISTDPTASRELRELRQRYARATGSAKQTLVRRLRRAELQAAAAAIDGGIARLEQRIEALLRAARAPDLFGQKTRLAREGREVLATLRIDLRELRQARRELRREGRLPWFSAAAQFADVMASGGFDLVAGNPPWVRAEALAPGQRERLSRRFRWWRTGGGRGYQHQPDLAVAFAERACELAAPGGTIALLLPEKLATAGYGAVMRGALTSSCTLHTVAPVPQDDAARFGATVYPMMLVAAKRVAAPDSEVRVSLDASQPPVPQQSLGAGPWVLGRSGIGDLLPALRAAHPRLGDTLRPRLGVKTGADQVFLDPDDVEAELLRPALRGRDVKPFQVYSRHRLLWTHDARGEPLKSLPPRARAWIAHHADQLRARSDARPGVPWTLFRVRGALDPWRVTWADVSRALHAAALVRHASDHIPLNTCYVVSVSSSAEADALAAWLNAPPVRSLAAASAPPASGGYRRHSASVVEELPLPVGVLESAALREVAESCASDGEDTGSLARIAGELLGLDRDDCRRLASLE